MLKIKEAIIVEGRYDRIRLRSLVDTAIIETGGFRIFRDKEKRALIRAIAEKRGIILLTDSDGAGFVIRNFLKGAVDPSMIKNAYIPCITGKERRKSQPSKENLLGVEGVSDRVIIDALINSGATVLRDNEEQNSEKSPQASDDCKSSPKREEISKALFYELGLTGSANSEIKRKAILKELNLPHYMTANAMVSALNMLMDGKALRELCEKCEISKL